MRGESSRPGKRPLRSLSAAEKLEAIQRVHNGESKASVARDIGVPESTLRGWCKSEDKIRSMARNSATPDSEALSPASSSGANPLISNLSSEDEGMGGPSSKKLKLDLSGAAGCSLGDSAESADIKLEAAKQQQQQQQQHSQLDYVGLFNSILASGVRSENSGLLLQQLGMLTGAQSAASLTKNLLSLSAAAGLGSSHLGLSSAQAVGLVENGLQYSKSSVGHSGANLTSTASGGGGGGSANKRHSTSSSSAHTSAIAPTSQLDSVSKYRKSLPPAAEAPSTPVPASPRKTNDQHNGSAMAVNQTPRSSSKSGKDTGSTGSSRNNKADEAFWLWLAQQQQLLGHQAAFNTSANGVDGSWFWQWYKQCTYPPVVSPTPLTAQTTQQQQQQQQQHHHHHHQSSNQHATPAPKKSPSKAKALLDNVLLNNNNNNDKVRRSLNLSGSNAGDEDDEATAANEDEALIPTEEAIEHGDKFFKWLDKCSEPSVTRLQIIQFKYLLDNLKSCKNSNAGNKQRRRKKSTTDQLLRYTEH